MTQVIKNSKGVETLLIPVNMRDGSLLCRGKGNEEWNYSASHGAGRLMSRTRAKASVELEDFQTSMTGVYSTSVGKSTLDEAPQAYKSMNEIRNAIVDTVDVIDVLKPLYNFKASYSFHALHLYIDSKLSKITSRSVEITR